MCYFLVGREADSMYSSLRKMSPHIFNELLLQWGKAPAQYHLWGLRKLSPVPLFQGDYPIHARVKRNTKGDVWSVLEHEGQIPSAAWWPHSARHWKLQKVQNVVLAFKEFSIYWLGVQMLWVICMYNICVNSWFQVF